MRCRKTVRNTVMDLGKALTENICHENDISLVASYHINELTLFDVFKLN